MASRKFVDSPYLRTACALLGVTVMASLWWGARDKILHGWNDFVTFYAGSQLAGSTDLYDQQRIMQVEKETTGASGEVLQFIRPPYYALALWPLGRLPFRPAYLVWQTVCFAAVVAFIALWPFANRWPAILACSWSVPLSASFAEGQDATFLLVWIALALRFYEERPFLAGLLLSLCAAKFHLFLLLPILIVVQQRWRLASGLLTGAGVMLAVSFAAAGLDWPMAYYHLLRTQKISPDVQIMPNLHGLLPRIPHANIVEIVLGILVAVAIGFVARRYSFQQAVAATLIGGLLVSHHAYPADAVLLIPALLLILFESGWPGLRMIAFILLTPVATLGIIMGGAYMNLVLLALVFVVTAMAFLGTRQNVGKALHRELADARAGSHKKV